MTLGNPHLTPALSPPSEGAEREKRVPVRGGVNALAVLLDWSNDQSGAKDARTPNAVAKVLPLP